jgi:hypothetical protein
VWIRRSLSSPYFLQRPLHDLTQDMPFSSLAHEPLNVCPVVLNAIIQLSLFPLQNFLILVLLCLGFLTIVPSSMLISCPRRSFTHLSTS